MNLIAWKSFIVTNGIKSAIEIKYMPGNGRMRWPYLILLISLASVLALSAFVYRKAWVIPDVLQRDIREAGGKAVGPLSWIRLRGEPEENREFLTRLASVNRTTAIEVRNGISDQVIEVIAQMHWLRNVTIEGSVRPSSDVFKGYSDIPYLEHIHLTDMDLTSVDLRPLLGGEHLRFLLLDNVQLDGAAVNAISQAGSVRIVVLKDVTIGDSDLIDDSDLEVLSKCKSVTLLRCCGTQITVEGIASAREERPGVEFVVTDECAQ